MSDRVYIINRALVRIGAGTISALTDANEQARKAAALFDGLARAEIRRQAWSFAIRRATLAILLGTGGEPLYDSYGAALRDELGDVIRGTLTTEIGGFSSVYNLPGDCLRIVEVDDNWVFDTLRGPTDSGGAYYAIEGRRLFTQSSAPSRLRYVADMAGNPAVWDAAFEDVFVYRLAADLVPSLKQNIQLRREVLNDYKFALTEAKRTNAIELAPESIADGSWITARYA